LGAIGGKFAAIARILASLSNIAAPDAVNLFFEVSTAKNKPPPSTQH
jgi:hypothetical protein